MADYDVINGWINYRLFPERQGVVARRWKLTELGKPECIRSSWYRFEKGTEMTAKNEGRMENGMEIHKRRNQSGSAKNGNANGTVKHGTNGEKCSELLVHEVPPQFREMFIISGYRRPYSTAKECFLSLFRPCNNECMNVWTHLLPLMCFIVHFGRTLSGLSLSDPYNYPLICFALGICGFCSMSCGAHTFNCMSPRLRHICFFFDYAAIAVYCFGASQVFFYYGRPAFTDVTLFKSRWLFLGISAVISLGANFLCCASRHRWLAAKYIIRTMPFVIVFLFIVSPVVWRTFTCDEPTDCNAESLPYHKRHGWFYVFSALINVARLPVRLMPGTFDYIGNSHHFLHLFTALGAADEFSAIFSDMTRRRAILSTAEGPTFMNSVGLMAVFSALNIVIVLYFASTLKSDSEEDNSGTPES